MTSPQIAKKLEIWKKKLLDLSKRNRLINFTTTRTIKAVDPDFYELYRKTTAGHILTLSYYSDSVPYDTPVEKLPPNVRICGNLRSDLSVAEANKTAKYLRTKARTISEEQGINVLYLAFGFLEWRENGMKESYFAPLILVPMKVVAERVKGPYKFTKEDDEIIFNPTLRFILEERYHLTIPQYDESSTDLDAFFDELADAVNDLGWEVHSEAAFSILSFAKLNMYNDLESRRDVLSEHAVIRELAGDAPTSPSAVASPVDSTPPDHDALYSPEQTYQILDADSSQQDAVLYSKLGRSFVLQGPPGTGKSQTITNIIAEALAAGKKVLFVSEKAAALDVVYRRLADVGLGPFCLILHSAKINKRDFVQELGDTLNRRYSSDRIRVDPDLAPLHELQTLRDELNCYCRELHELVEPLSSSIFHANGALATYRNAPNLPFAAYRSPTSVDQRGLTETRVGIRSFLDAVARLDEDSLNHTWRHVAIEDASPLLRGDLEILLESLLKNFDEPFRSYDASFRAKSDVEWRPPFRRSEELLDAWRDAANVKAFPSSWTRRSDAELAQIGGRLKPFATSARDERKLRETLEASFQPSFFQLDGSALFEETRDAFSWYRSALCEEKQGLSERDALALSEQVHDEVAAGLARLDEYLKVIDSIVDELELVARPDSFDELPSFAEFLRLLSRPLKPVEFWFDPHWRDERARQGVFEEARALAETVCQNRSALEGYRLAESSRAILDVASPNRGQRFQASLLTRLEVLVDALTRQEAAFEGVVAIGSKLAALLQQPNPRRYLDVKALLAATKSLFRLPKLADGVFSKEWLDEKFRAVLFDDAVKTRDALVMLRQTLTDRYEKEILDFDCVGVVRRFKTDYASPLRFLKGAYRKDMKELRGFLKSLGEKFSYKSALAMLTTLRDYRDAAVRWNDLDAKLRDYLGEEYRGEESDFEELRNLADAIAKFLSRYPDGVPETLRNALKVGAVDPTLQDALDELERRWEHDLDWRVVAAPQQESPELLFEDFRQRLRILKEFYEKSLSSLRKEYDLRLVADDDNASSTTPTCGFETLETFATDLERYLASATLLARRADEFRRYLGDGYCGEWTDFAERQESLDAFDAILERYQGRVPEALKQALLNGQTVGRYDVVATAIDAMKRDDAAIVRTLQELEASFSELPLTRLREECQTLVEKIDLFLGRLADVYALHLPDAPRVAPRTAIMKLKTLQELEATNRHNATIASQELEFLFQGPTTDWRDVADRLVRARRFIGLSRRARAPQEFLELVATNPEASVAFETYANWLDSFWKKLEPTAEKFLQHFEPSFSDSFKTLDEFFQYLLRCRNHLPQLDDWLEFQRTKRFLDARGLDELVDAALKQTVKLDELEGAFVKRFTTVWLDYAHRSRRHVAKFNLTTQNRRVDRFRELDVMQLEIAAQRLTRILDEAQTLSSFSGAAGNVRAARSSELGILLHETSKKSRFMPVRKLIGALPNILPVLKPCVMTSPIGVSLYFQSESYKFDLVVFDEASQVRTENAIGAISRGQQLIISGDVNQLPPTSFFAGSTASDDDEYDEEADDSDAYESMLDELSPILPTVSLKWHYRSRNEGLIAFSNRRIYDSSLTTFPAPFDKSSDGVSMVYVPDGWFLRGKSRNNPTEAKRVADVVFEQLDKFPNRSLGVVTFSESQRKIVEDELERRRVADQSYEEFFSEDRQDPFFVKNLENVQGDERDTIIFSVGYGKAGPNEELKMNFGPLNRGGGERRLNVAITRAKYAVIVVSSIKAQEMRVTSSTPKGVALLRDYLAYAEQGARALGDMESNVDERDGATSFEKVVVDFLRSKGYDVATRVGTSEYRIDIAIRSPLNRDKYILGIECDGEAYKSARTARDRDRLRQSVLESMGWRFYRVWSVEWVKNPAEEERRLLDAVESALADAQKLESGGAAGVEGTARSTNVRVADRYPTEEDLPPAPYNFSYYRTMRLVGDGVKPTEARLVSAIRDVVGELAPIHVRQLCLTLLPLFGPQGNLDEVVKGVDALFESGRLAPFIKKETDPYCYLPFLQRTPKGAPLAGMTQYPGVAAAEQIDGKGGFYLWRKTQLSVKPRVPAPKTTPRPFGDIPFAEIAEAYLAIVEAHPGSTRQELDAAFVDAFQLDDAGRWVLDCLAQPAAETEWLPVAPLDLLVRDGRINERAGRFYLV